MTVNRSLLLATMIALVACDADDPVPLPDPTMFHIVRGIVRDSSGRTPREALLIIASVLDPRILGTDREGDCVGSLGSRETAVPSRDGTFLVPVTAYRFGDTRCIALSVFRAGTIAGTATIPDAFFRFRSKGPPDTSRVTITIR